jgi:hypothetical protein
MASATKEAPRHLAAVPDAQDIPRAIVVRVSRAVSVRLGIIAFTAGKLVTEPGLIYAAITSGLPYDVPEEA